MNSPHHIQHQDVSQVINALHPNFNNLRFAAKEIEQELNIDQKKSRPVGSLLEMVKAQLEASCQQHQLHQSYSTPKG